MNQLDLRGRTAVVTGGASGIGYAVAQRLIASGARISIWDSTRSATLAHAAHVLGDVHAHPVDVRDYASVEAAHAATRRELERIDILVNSAGITGPNAPAWDYPLDAWRDVVDVNLTGTFHCCRAIVPDMRETGYGRIVNIASVAGKEGNPNASAYSASKAGVIALTKSLGKELATAGVRVNCVTPAAVESPMFAQMSEAHIDYMKSKIPMNRFGNVDEVAALIAWLCTEECTFSTGAVFDISGGRATY